MREFVAARRGELLADLSEWVRIPSVSADPERASDVQASAEWWAARLREAGFPTVEIWPTAGAPAVFAEWPSDDADAPTVVVYGHHDVQPVDPVELWESAPFEPFVRQGPHGEEIVGRGVIDDKGQVLYHVYGLAAHLATTGRTSPAVSLKLLVEGEEENGSPHFRQLLLDRRDRLGCDVVVVSDTGIFDRATPSVVVSMRGMVRARIDLTGPDGDLHSGQFGGAVPNPATVIARIVARLHDADGRVQLPGFYDKVVELTPQQRELVERLPFDEAAWLQTAQSRATYGEKGQTTLERIGARPTAEVNGIWGGYTGPGGKTIVPSEAHAHLSFRLVADQDPGDVGAQLEAFLGALRADGTIPDGIGLTLTVDRPGVRPCSTPMDHPALGAVVRSMQKAFDTDEILFTREGGSGPEADLEELLGPVLFMGVLLPDDRIHAPNEKADVELLLKGAEAVAHLWADLGSTAV